MLATAAEPPVAVATLLWGLNGLAQGYVVTLMALSMQLTPEQRRGRVFGVAGAGFNAMAIVGLVGVGRRRRTYSPAAAAGLGGAFGMTCSDRSLGVAAAQVRSAVRVSSGRRAGVSSRRRGDMKALVKRVAEPGPRLDGCARA